MNHFFRHIVSTAVCLFGLWFVFGLSARSTIFTAGSESLSRTESAFGPDAPQQSQYNGSSDRVYGKSNRARSGRLGDSIVKFLLGDVMIYHQGVVITCDSAVQYNADLIVGYKNVIINKGTTFIYGDKIEYNGATSEAKVYSPIVKTVDKDAVMYTYNMAFNTQTNIGYYTGGGTMNQGDNSMESQRGYYYADLRELVGVGSVLMSSPDYDFSSDSVRFNMDSEVAHFFSRSYVWNKDDQILTALRGSYDTKNEKYEFFDQAYILSGANEVWADSLFYDKTSEDALLLGNVQVVDTSEMVIAFGDRLNYWGREQNGLLTRRPVVLRYDPQEDTLFMRGDSIFLFSMLRGEAIAADSLVVDYASIDSMGLNTASVGDSLALDQALTIADSLPLPGSDAELLAAAITKQNREDSTSSGELTARDKREQRRRIKAEARVARAESRLRSIEQLTVVVGHDHQQGEEHADDHRLHVQDIFSDIPLALADSSGEIEIPVLTGLPPDSLPKDDVDSMLRVLKAYSNVKIFRSDFQAVCDSLVGFSVDSTLHMYKTPILWNENNQVQAEYIDVYFKNKLIERAIFNGDPIMSSKVESADSAQYSQIKGNLTTLLFRDGELYRADIEGSCQTYFYSESEDSVSKWVSAFMTMDNVNTTYYFENRDIVHITWSGGPDYKMTPIHLLTDKEPQILPGFEWLDEQRPTRDDIFDRSIRQTERESYQQLERPLFPITHKVESQRKRLLEARLWIDRRDDISEKAKEYVKEVGVQQRVPEEFQ